VREQEEPSLAEVLARLAPADLVLVEGFKTGPHPKIEVRADESRPMAPADYNIVAIAAARPGEAALPSFSRDDIAGLADFIAAHVGAKKPVDKA
jgi:molybdopterin-guanine dinucleotide biosynthesis protein B